MAELGDWPVSVRSASDWVTPLRTSPRTSLFSLLRECGLTPDCHCQTTDVRITPVICYSRHTGRIEGYVFCSSIIVVLIIWYCFGVSRIRAMASDGLPDREQTGLSYAPSVPCQGRFWGPRWTFGRRVCMS